MKKFTFVLCLLLVLTACGQQAPSEPSPAPAESQQEEVQVPETSVPAEQPEAPSDSSDIPAADPEPAPAPEAESEEEPRQESAVPEPQTEAPAGPTMDLSQDIYCYEDTVIDKHGKVLFQVPGTMVREMYDRSTGKIRAVAAVSLQTYNVIAVYNLDGTVLADGLTSRTCGIFGDLFWFDQMGLSHVYRISDGQMLYEDLELVQAVDDYLVLQSGFWLSPCTLLDKHGDVVRELERGFHLTRIFTDQGKTYLCMEGKDGSQNLTDLKGKSYLGRFYDEISGVACGKAVVRDGSQWLAVDLKSGKTSLQQQKPFVLLPDGALVDTEPGKVKLVDSRGNWLRNLNLEDLTLLDLDDDGTPDRILNKELKNDAYCTVLLDLQGKELLTLPTEPQYITPVSQELLFYSVPTGERAFYETAYLRNLKTGEEQKLLEGSYLTASVLDTDSGTAILCHGLDQNDQSFAALYTPEGEQLLADFHLVGCAGPDVFTDDLGLICIDGSRLYTK